MHETIHLHRGSVDQSCCTGRCTEPDGLCPLFTPPELREETPADRHRFCTRLGFCIALIGFGIWMLWHAWRPT